MDGGVECPENDCGIPFNSAEEVVAHLQWDHNRSELEAERKVREMLDTQADHTQEADHAGE